MIIGDFNLVMDVDKDRLNTYHNNEKSRDKLVDIMDEFCLRDVWRQRYPDSKMYSWLKKSGGMEQKGSRIDFALISAGLDQKIENCMYFSVSHTDHRAFLIVIDLCYIERGRGYWKINTLLMHDESFVQNINNGIEQILYDYRDEKPSIRWEKLKEEVKKRAVKYSRIKGSEEKLIIAQLSEKISEMEDRMPLIEAESNLLAKTKDDFDLLMEERAKGVIFRSKANWYEYGEKEFKIFFLFRESKI